MNISRVTDNLWSVMLQMFFTLELGIRWKTGVQSDMDLFTP